jgi:hypothetical protein
MIDSEMANLRRPTVMRRRSGAAVGLLCLRHVAMIIRSREMSERLERIMPQTGWFPRRFVHQAAKRIAPHSDPARNILRSWQIVRNALLAAADT